MMGSPSRQIHHHINMRLCVVLSSILILAGAAAEQLLPKYVCPKYVDDPLEVEVPDGVNTVTVTINKTSQKTLCTLVKVTATGENVSLDSFSSTSNSEDFTLVPISRSVLGLWEAVAGPYRVKVTKKKKLFRIKVPIDPDPPKEFKLFLISHKRVPAPSKKEIRARFLEQATFGPTLESLNNWQFSDGTDGFSEWIQSQVKMEMTSHRAYWRKHADWAMIGEHPRFTTIIPRHPCEKYSRWRDYAFTSADAGEFIAYPLDVGGTVMAMFLVKGEPRSVVPLNSYVGGIGTFTFCARVTEEVGGTVVYNRGFGCLESMPNPKIFLPGQVFSTPFAKSLKITALPAISNFEVIPGVKAPGGLSPFNIAGESLRMTVDNTAPQCVGLTNDFTNLIGFTSDGNQLHFAGHATIHENTVEDPAPDGGAHVIPFHKIPIPHPVPGLLTNMQCSTVAMDFTNANHCRLSSESACAPSAYRPGSLQDPVVKENVVLCGSHGEVANDPNLDASKTNMFRLYGTSKSIFNALGLRQKTNVWAMITMEAPDQLRQRVAWVLAQLLVITPSQIEESPLETESFLKYYDIFVRHAFGNYRDILKEVAYSPMMAEMLSFLNSKSAAYVKRNEDRDSRPDENFAREIMQLFTIGLVKLNPDGSAKMKKGSPVLSYDNTDIQTFARAWTGFVRQHPRGNLDMNNSNPNRIDPMAIRGYMRDQFPKKGLNTNVFIGDDYPLCVDQVDYQFLRKGSTYRLLGSHDIATLHHENALWSGIDFLKRSVLDPSTSSLYEELCNADDFGNCNFQPQVTLEMNHECDAGECKVDNFRVVQVQSEPPVYYEYIRPACVELAFSDNSSLKKVVNILGDAMCQHVDINDAVSPICCTTTDLFAPVTCESSMERTSYETASNRCDNYGENPIGICDWHNLSFDDMKCAFFFDNDQYRPFFWTNQSCLNKVKVKDDGMVAVVHEPNMDINQEEPGKQRVDPLVDEENNNFFKVEWKKGAYPKSSDQCGGCETLSDGSCLCDLELTNWSFTKMPSLKNLKQKLQVGSQHPDVYGDYTLNTELSTKTIAVYSRKGFKDVSRHTIFGIEKNGKTMYLKNIRYTVEIPGTKFSFRNPPTFMNYANPEPRDAHYETDAVLDHYFYNTNTPPFIAIRFIQRFGISNPSPKYIKAVADAFRKGRFKFNSQVFGNGEYGNLEATVAAVLLNKEARTDSLYEDPTAGSFREPILKLIAFFRAMELENNIGTNDLRLDGLSEIGEDPYWFPNVFSFFKPEYSAPRQISDASLTSPEAQVMNSPAIIGLINGLYSLIDIGLSSCFGGLGDTTTLLCDSSDKDKDPLIHSHGIITYSPSSSDPINIVDELALLLTAGRLNSKSREFIRSAYMQKAEDEDEAQALRLAQKLIVTSPEFQSTGSFYGINQPRPEPTIPQPTDHPYKAVVFLNLNGGMDGFNMLVPKGGCSTNMEQQYAQARGNVALDPSTLLPIDAQSSNQICDTFGLHQSLPFIQKLYTDKELAFISNIGLLQAPSDKTNWAENQKDTILFSHNSQTEESAFVDVLDVETGIGIAGRILDTLARKNDKPHLTGAVSVSGTALPMVSETTPLLVVDPWGFEKINPSGKYDVTDDIKGVNNATHVGGSFFGDTWSNVLHQSLAENALLYEKYNNAKVTANFPGTYFGLQLTSIAKLMQTNVDRVTDRDIFFLDYWGWDMHFNLASPLSNFFSDLNNGLEAFKEEMLAQSKWDDVTIVLVTEFGRTLMGNTGLGSDHAWGNNLFVAGGSVTGGKILGEFPELASDKPLIFPPGIVVPTTPWESMWNAVAQWFGVSESDLDDVLPNRGVFDNLFEESDLFA